MAPSGGVLAAAATLLGVWSGAAAAPAKPHLVYVLADDYGWANMGVHQDGSDPQAAAEVHTPTLDGLVAEGVLLDRFYAYQICSPSRTSLQSGRLAVHVNTVNTGVTVTNASDPVSGYSGMPRNMTGIAQKLRSAGYRAHAVGKWDVGMATPEHTPLGRGYETWTGYFQHANDYWRKNMVIESTGEIDNCLNHFMDLSMHNATYRGGVRDSPSTSGECAVDPETKESCYEEALFLSRGLDVINSHDLSDPSSPLFLFYSFHLLHSPLQVPQSYLDRVDALVASAGAKPFDSRNRRLYAAMVLYMDEVVGQLVAALKARDMWKDTLLVFSSDNGGPIYEPGSANNFPLKGGKYNDYEGGVRVNAFLSGGFVPPTRRGSTFEGVISIADIYGTFCELAGVDATDHAAAAANEWLRERNLPLLPPVDSVAQWGFIMNNTNGRPELQLSQKSLLRWPYKLVSGKQAYAAWAGQVYPNCSTVEEMENHEGPLFVDGKVFDVVVNPFNSTEEMEKVTWTHDCGSGCLYNVAEDPTEHRDLAQDPAFAELLADMAADLRALNRDLFEPGRGVVGVEACDMGIQNGGFYGPFIDAADWYSPVLPVPERSARDIAADASYRAAVHVLAQRIKKQGAEEASKMLRPLMVKASHKQFDECLTPDNATMLIV